MHARGWMCPRPSLLALLIQLGWHLMGSRAQSACLRPSTAGYDFSSASETLEINSFQVTGVACSSGYTGTPSATVCSADGGEYGVSGCTWRCLDASPPPPPGTLPDANGLVNVPESSRSYSSTWQNAQPGEDTANSMLDST